MFMKQNIQLSLLNFFNVNQKMILSVKYLIKLSNLPQMSKINRDLTTELHDFKTYNMNDLYFDAPIERKLPNNANIKFLSVPYYTKNREFN